jgi:hypothetical protein
VTSPPVASTVDTLYDLAAELLGFCAAALDTLPAGAPDRQYVSIGPPALDCDQLTVHVLQVGEGQTSPANTPLDRMRRGVTVPRIELSFMVVTIVRECYPGPTGKQLTRPPEVADLNAAARIISADGWLLYNAVPAALAAGELWGACNFTGWEPLQPIPASGNVAGWTFPMQVKIDGFSPDLPV